MKLSIRAKIAAVVALVALPFAAFAGEAQPYSKSAFEQAKNEGKSILLDFKADWCPTCRAQSKTLDSLLESSEFDHVVAFTVNYDKEGALKKEFRVVSQSTLVVLKGDKEINRAIGITDSKSIAKLLSSGS